MVETGSGIASGQAFGSLATRFMDTAAGISSVELFGDDRQLLFGTGTGIASAETFGSAAIRFNEYAAGIASGEAFGSDQQVISETGTGIVSEEGSGSAAVAFIEYAAGIPSEEAFGNRAVVQTSTIILHPVLTGVVPPRVRDAELKKKLNRRFRAIAIKSEEAFGTPDLKLEFDPYDPELIAAHNQPFIALVKPPARFVYDRHGRIIEIISGCALDDAA